MLLITLQGDLFLHIDQTGDTRCFIIFTDIIGKFTGGNGLPALGIFEHESSIKAHGLNHIQRILKIFLFLRGKSHNNIGGQGQVG